jgi:membrane protein CcdC involved in cytochrome C biogenesis
LDSLGKSLLSRVVTVVLVVAAAGGGFWFYKHPEQLAALWHVLKNVLLWLGFAAILPWATFFIPRYVVKKDSNAAAAVMLVGYLLVDIVMAFVLLGGVRGHGTLVWIVLLVGCLLVAVYNYAVCDYQAEMLEDM